MKTATYIGKDDSPFTIEYDEMAPCRICGHPVLDASCGGTDVCPWCDAGSQRPENMLGSTNVTFKCGNKVKQFQRLTDTNPLTKLKVYEIVEVDFGGGKLLERQIKAVRRAKEFWGWEIEYEIDDGVTFYPPPDMLDKWSKDIADEIDKEILNDMMKVLGVDLNKKVDL